MIREDSSTVRSDTRAADGARYITPISSSQPCPRQGDFNPGTSRSSLLSFVIHVKGRIINGPSVFVQQLHRSLRMRAKIEPRSDHATPDHMATHNMAIAPPLISGPPWGKDVYYFVPHRFDGTVTGTRYDVLFYLP